MINKLKEVWNWIWGKAKTLLSKLVGDVVDTVEEIVKDKELIDLAMNAIKAAALDGFTGTDAFAEAKKRLIDATKEAGKEIKNSVANLVIELVYNSWKNLGYPCETPSGDIQTFEVAFKANMKAKAKEAKKLAKKESKTKAMSTPTQQKVVKKTTKKSK